MANYLTVSFQIYWKLIFAGIMDTINFSGLYGFCGTVNLDYCLKTGLNELNLVEVVDKFCQCLTIFY